MTNDDALLEWYIDDVVCTQCWTSLLNEIMNMKLDMMAIYPNLDISDGNYVYIFYLHDVLKFDLKSIHVFTVTMSNEEVMDIDYSFDGNTLDVSSFIKYSNL